MYGEFFASVFFQFVLCAAPLVVQAEVARGGYTTPSLVESVAGKIRVHGDPDSKLGH